jgi:pilus assembly protein TadC
MMLFTLFCEVLAEVVLAGWVAVELFAELDELLLEALLLVVLESVVFELTV